MIKAVSRDKDGYYWVTNRVNDMIKVSGSMISPYEVENAVLAHPAITDCAVVSAPDPLKGNSLHLYVVLTNGFDDCLKIEIKKHGKSIVININFHNSKHRNYLEREIFN